MRSYELCLASLASIKKIATPIKRSIGYSEVPSLQFASYQSHRKNLSFEFDTRKKFGIGSINWLETKDTVKLFGIETPGAILSKEGATVDAYAFTHALLEESVNSGAAKVYDGTLVKKIQHGRNNVAIFSEKGQKLNSRYLIIACGYESQKYLSKKVEISNSTYAIVSEPLEDRALWYKNAMIWETVRPYLYIRRTDSNRIVVGGKDDKFYNPAKRDGKLNQKAESLKNAFCKLFPSIEFRIDFKWAGYFGNTKDGLPYIGSVPERPNTYFALGFGGDGIVFSVIAAELITDILSGKKNKDLPVFSFNR